jgi:hypothetical protein
MATISESLPTRPIHDALVAGVDTLGQNQQVSFVPYVRQVLPVDGFAFWINANLLTPVQIAQNGLTSADTVVVDGSLHYASVGSQVADETIVVRSVDFTAETEIQAFAEIAPNVIYVGQWTTPMGSFNFTFGARNSFYRQANIFHYVGDAVYPAFEAQLVDDLSSFDQSRVVSNSLPIWLSMMTNIPPYSLVNISVPVFPAFLVPTNTIPSYVAIEILPNTTRALQAIPLRTPSSMTHIQLASERVKMISYGLRNNGISDLMDYVLDYSASTGNIGIMGAPIIRDEHRPQVELAALAQKKVIEWEVSYFQFRAREIARQLILSAGVSFPIVEINRYRVTQDDAYRVTEDLTNRKIGPPVFNTDMPVAI